MIIKPFVLCNITIKNAKKKNPNQTKTKQNKNKQNHFYVTRIEIVLIGSFKSAEVVTRRLSG